MPPRLQLRQEQRRREPERSRFACPRPELRRPSPRSMTVVEQAEERNRMQAADARTESRFPVPQLPSRNSQLWLVPTPYPASTVATRNASLSRFDTATPDLSPALG